MADAPGVLPFGRQRQIVCKDVHHDRIQALQQPVTKINGFLNRPCRADPFTVGGCLLEHGLFQIVRPRREMDTLKIRVGYAGTPELAQVRDALVDAVEAAVGLRAEIELVPEAVILQSGSRHKIPRTVKA